MGERRSSRQLGTGRALLARLRNFCCTPTPSPLRPLGPPPRVHYIHTCRAPAQIAMYDASCHAPNLWLGKRNRKERTQEKSGKRTNGADGNEQSRKGKERKKKKWEEKRRRKNGKKKEEGKKKRKKKRKKRKEKKRQRNNVEAGSSLFSQHLQRQNVS